jgi:hypothetical protein
VRANVTGDSARKPGPEPHCYGMFMTSDKLTCLVALLMLTGSPAYAKKPKRFQPIKQAPLPADSKELLQETLPAVPKHVLACAGAFARDSSHAKLAAEFGAKNVVFKEVDGPDGAKDKATVLFDEDPTRRAVVFWHDAGAKAGPALIDISAPSTWIGPGGIHNGLPLAEVERLNGGAFKIKGFGSKASGVASSFKGVLGAPPGGCTLTVRFEPGIANPLPPKFSAITGDKDVPSSNPLMRRTRAQVSEWTVNYQ